MEPSTIFDRALKSEVYSEFDEMSETVAEGFRRISKSWYLIEQLLRFRTWHDLTCESVIELSEHVDSLRVFNLKQLSKKEVEWRGAIQLVAVANSNFLTQYESTDRGLVNVGSSAITGHSHAINICSGIIPIILMLRGFIAEHPLNCRTSQATEHRAGPLIEYLDSDGATLAVVGLGQKRNIRWLDFRSFSTWRGCLSHIETIYNDTLGPKPQTRLSEIDSLLEIERVRVCAFLTQTPWILEYDVSQTEADKDLVSRSLSL